MLTPEQLLYLPDNLVRLYAQLEEDILADMAARISARELFIPAADWQFQKLAEMGNTYDMILAKLSAATEKTEQELREMMTVAASESLKYDDAVHKAAGKELPPLNQSAALLATLNAGMEKTKGYFQNLCRTTANHGSKQFVDALDRAYMQVISGAFTKEQAIKTAVKDLTSQGIAAAEYKNGRKMSLESAVRMNVVTGVNQTCASLQLQRCDEAGCDLVEVSAHAGARPSHAVWQGKLYSRSGTHPKYPDFALSTGYGTVTGLCGANCRHNFYPFYEGISKRAYTHRELGQMNARTIRYNGQRLTEYEASQVQRKLERNLRRWKREQAAMKAAGQSTAEAAAKLNYWRGEMDSFIRQTGFKRQYSREEIFGKNSAVKLPGVPSGGKMKIDTGRMQGNLQELLKDCTTSADIGKISQAYFQNKQGCRIKEINFLGVYPDAAKAMALKLDELDNRFHSSLVSVKTKALGADYGGACTISRETVLRYLQSGDDTVLESYIVLNSDFLSSKEIIKADFRLNSRSPNNGVAHLAMVNEENMYISSLLHEYGHSILSGAVNELYLSNGGKNGIFMGVRRLFRQYKGQLSAKKLEIQKVRASFAGQPDGLRKGNEATKALWDEYKALCISEYSYDSVGEFIAEAFCDYELSSTPKEYSKKLHDILEKSYGKKG